MTEAAYANKQRKVTFSIFKIEPRRASLLCEQEAFQYCASTKQGSYEISTKVWLTNHSHMAEMHNDEKIIWIGYQIITWFTRCKWVGRFPTGLWVGSVVNIVLFKAYALLLGCMTMTPFAGSILPFRQEITNDQASWVTHNKMNGWWESWDFWAFWATWCKTFESYTTHEFHEAP